MKRKNLVLLWAVLKFSFVFHSCLGSTSYDLQPMGKLNKIEVGLEKGELMGFGQIRGSFNRMKGQIVFSTKNSSATSGNILIDSSSLRFGYKKVNEDAQQQDWLDSTKFPEISFQLQGLRKEYWGKETLQAEAFGILFLKRYKAQISFPVNLKFLRAERRKYDGKRGDIILIKGQISLSRGQLGIQPGGMLDVIKDNLNIKVTLVGCSDKNRPLLPSRLFL
jgi:polyisoprenoid-binding protein YceI